MIRSNTRGVYADDIDGYVGDRFWRVRRLADEIETRRRDLGKTSGFERQYPKVVSRYFGGMATHLRNLRRVLKAGGRAVYIVGDQASFFRVLIPTGEILADIAEGYGFRVESLEIVRQRTATATGNKLNENALILEYQP